ncbi:unnamed protein product [Urochloa humidicola]
MAAAHRPLLVMHHVKGHYEVYDISIEEEDEQWLKVYPMSHSVVEPLHYRPLAVSAGSTSILGVTPQAAGLMMRPPPIMLPVGDDGTVVRMDTIIYYGDISSRFEMLRPLAGGWHTIPLPKPPFRTLRLPHQNVSITAYFAMGTRAWISVTGEGTFSFDTQVGTWRMEFPEELRRLEGRAFFAPELGSVVGLTGGDDKFLCSYNLSDKGVPLAWQHTWSEAVPWECSRHEYAVMRDKKASLAYLGDGRFCVYRPVKKVPGSVFNFNTYLVLELRRRFPDGSELEIAKRSAVCCHGCLPEGLFQDTYFIQ